MVRSESNKSELLWVSIILLVIMSSATIDIYFDLRAGSRLSHVALEIFMAAFCFTALLVIWGRKTIMARQLVNLADDLAKTRQDAKKWKAESHRFVNGLVQAIDDQFMRWDLTASEKEIALLLLKGLSHKEIAEVRATSERTVRQQAFGVYSKSGLGGRAELSAFFLEDLLVSPAKGHCDV